MSENFKLDIATLEDTPVIMGLLRLLDESPDFDASASIPFQSSDDAKNTLQQIIDSPNSDVYVLKDSHQVICATFAMYCIPDMAHKDTYVGVLENLIVSPNYRSQRLGELLLNHAKDIAKQKNCYKIILSTHNSRKRTHGFYDRNGFEPTGVSYSIDILKE